MSVRLLAALSATLLLAQPAAAQEEATTVEGVEVTARPAPPEEAIKAFVAGVSAPNGGKRLGRWDRKICTGVVGLKPAYAQLMIERIGKAATDVGLTVGESGCKPNMVVIATEDSEAMVKSLVKDSPQAFAKYDGEVTRGRKAFEAFMASPAPVRWWHVGGRVSADGQKYEEGGEVTVRGLGRVRAGTRADFDHVIIVIDVKRAGVLRFGALSDYIAMVGLAQVEPEAETDGVSTILNLFADRAVGATPPEGLTSWDVAYLKGLYDARRDVKRSETQERDMVGSMRGQLAKPPKADPEPK